MAIGDNNNSNLFGTNYNPEDEEEKKARLAAQNARMGAGGVGTPSDRVFVPSLGMAPQSLVDQVTQLPPMQEPIPIEVAPPITNDVANGGMQLREPKQTDGGVLGLGSVDVESPLAITGTPDFSNLNLNGVNLQIPPELQFDTPGIGEVGLTNLFDEGSLPRIVTESAGATGDFVMEKTKDLVEFLTGRSLPAGDKTTSEVERSLAFLQSPEVQARMKATQGATPPVETPSEGAQGQTAALDPTSDEAILARKAEREAQFAPTSGLTTVGGASLSEFLSGQAMPEQGFTQEESPLGGRGVTLTQDQMNQLSAEREARLDARLPGDQSVSDRDRRAARGDGISMADQVDMAKANARGATPREVARGNQVANALGLDLKTGQPPEGTGGLTESELQRRREFAYKQEQDILAGEKKAKETEGERSVNRAKAVGSLQALKADLDLIKETGEEVRTLTLKPRTEGLLAKALATVSPTSTAAQLERASGVLTGDAFIKGMQVIKAFGGGLGSVTEVEGLKVERAQGAIFENGMGDEERRQAVKDYIQVRENAYNRIREAFVKEYGETDAQTYLGTQNTNATAGKAIPNDRNVSVEVSPELEQYFN